MKNKIITIGAMLGIGLSSMANAEIVNFRWDAYTNPDRAGFYLCHADGQRENFTKVAIDDPDATEGSLDLPSGLNFIHVKGRVILDGVEKESNPSNEVSFYINEGLMSNFRSYAASPFQHPLFSYVDPDQDFATVQGGSFELLSIDDKIHAMICPPLSAVAKIPLSALNINWTNPILISKLYNDSGLNDIAMIIEDKNQKRGYYHSNPYNFSQGANMLLTRVTDPTANDLEFDHKNISYIYPDSEGINLEEILLEEGGVPITGNMTPGTNVSNVGNISDFDQNPFYNRIEGTRKDLRKRFVQASASGLNIPLENYDEIVMIFDMDSSVYGLLATDAININLDNVVYVLPKSNIRTGPQVVTLPLQTSGTATNATIQINTAGRLTSAKLPYFEGYVGVR